jgi:hypothetical protein
MDRHCNTTTSTIRHAAIAESVSETVMWGSYKNYWDDVTKKSRDPSKETYSGAGSKLRRKHSVQIFKEDSPLLYARQIRRSGGAKQAQSAQFGKSAPEIRQEPRLNETGTTIGGRNDEANTNAIKYKPALRERCERIREARISRDVRLHSPACERVQPFPADAAGQQTIRHNVATAVSIAAYIEDCAPVLMYDPRSAGNTAFNASSPLLHPPSLKLFPSILPLPLLLNVATNSPISGPTASSPNKSPSSPANKKSPSKKKPKSRRSPAGTAPTGTTATNQRRCKPDYGASSPKSPRPTPKPKRLPRTVSYYGNDIASA